MMMNGTVTMKTVPALFTDEALAKKTRQAVIKANEKNDGPIAISCYCSEVEEVKVFESEEEVPILADKQYEPKDIKM